MAYLLYFVNSMLKSGRFFREGVWNDT